MTRTFPSHVNGSLYVFFRKSLVRCWLTAVVPIRRRHDHRGCDMSRPAPTVPAVGYGDPVTDALVERLRTVGVGKRIPGERLLSDELGVSRTLLRDRLGTLEALGVLRRQTGAGTYVQELD